MTALNEHGVYSADEVLQLPMPRKGWRGCSLAEIRLAKCDDGWRSATAFQLLKGDCWGSCGPISARDPAHATREGAVETASAHLRARLADREGPDPRAIMAWLDGLQPPQLSLFAA